MIFKKLIKCIMATTILFSLSASAQNSEKIAGQYQFRKSLLVINPDNTFLIIGYGTLIKGAVEIKGADVKLIPYKPTCPFVLYGRTKQSRAKGNIVKFNGFDLAETLINYEENNNLLKKMKRLFNEGANCWPPDILLDNLNTNQKFYFAIKGRKEVYEFENNQGYNDFIALYLPQANEDENENTDINFTLAKDGNGLIYREEAINKLQKDAMSREEIKKMNEMYDRTFPKSEHYYCNPVYNYFEENGIDLSRYKMEMNGKEYYFLNIDNERGVDNDYNNIAVIYEYKKIEPTVLVNKSYSIDAGTVFTFTCD